MSIVLASLFTNPHRDLLRRILSAKTKAGATTAHRHAETLQLRNTILRNLSELRKSQRIYMPGIISTLDEMHNSEAPEDSLKLWLPSEVSADDRDAWCLPGIPFLEFRFRYAQADDCLAELRRLRRLLQGLQDQNMKHPSSSQGNVIRSQGLFVGFTARIKRSADRYSHARDAMLALDPDEKFRPGWTRRFLKLNDADVRGPGRERDDKSEGQFVLPWIWLVPRLSDPPAPLATAQDGPMTTADPPTASGAETTTPDEPTVASDAELADSMRVHWAKCQARAERYEEEVLLTVEEMGRTLNYFRWKQSWWLSLGSERATSDHPPPRDVQCGLSAYAHRQAAIYETLIVSFASRWRKSLVSHGFNPTWLSQFPDTADPLLSQPSRGHSRPETEAAPTATNNESTQTESDLPLPVTQPISETIDAPLSDEDTEEEEEEEDYVIDEVEGFDVEDWFAT